MGTRFILPALCVLLLWGCKEKAEKIAEEPTIFEVEKPKKLPRELLKITQFAGVSLSDSIDIHSQIRFKTIDLNGTIDSVNMEKGIELYKKRMKSGKGDLYPIFEVTGMEDVVVTTASKGYGGNIRGMFLIDATSLQIKKVEFEHVAESEGYGATIADTSFENQFMGATVNFGKNSFGLNLNGKILLEGVKTIDGISGATTTSRLTIEMVNNDLKKYKPYFEAKGK
ncbi:FMN-binding protein [Flagellimonas sp.]|uniref:FMN-binding protein n=1 Tax=Flagellimonas sp. TaxID=2058762 RepID=UPI003B50C3B0